MYTDDEESFFEVTCEEGDVAEIREIAARISALVRDGQFYATVC